MREPQIFQPSEQPESESAQCYSSSKERPDEPVTLHDEIRRRLIHIELKTDGVLDRLDKIAVETNTYRGHPDQAFGYTTYSQYGEDLIILNIFQILGIRQPSYLDVGAHHPFNISNTALLYLRGSRGINVEANPNLIDLFTQHRSEDINLNVGVAPTCGTLDFYFIDDFSGRNTFCREVADEFIRLNPHFSIQKILPVPVTTIEDIIADHANGRFPDLLNLDVEGLDVDILCCTSFDKSFPTVICVESELNEESNRARRLMDLLRGQNFELYARTVGNLIFVHADAMVSLYGYGA